MLYITKSTSRLPVTPSSSLGRYDAKNMITAHVTIPGGIRRILPDAFSRQVKIRTIVFPETLRIIMPRAFSSCTKLQELTLPSRIQSVENEAFSECAALHTVRIPASLNERGYGVFQDNRRLQHVEFVAGSRLQKIPEKAFYNGQMLNAVLLPEGIRSVDEQAFARCKSMTSIHLPEGLTVICRKAFHFAGLTELILPESLKTLEASAFQRCSSLTYVRIPSGVRYIGEQAFSGCDRMKILEIDHDPDFLGEHIVNHSTVIRCRKGSAVDAYCREYGYQTEYL